MDESVDFPGVNFWKSVAETEGHDEGLWPSFCFLFFTAQEMLSASISQTRILQTCGVPHPNIVNGANPLQGERQIHTEDKRWHPHSQPTQTHFSLLHACQFGRKHLILVHFCSALYTTFIFFGDSKMTIFFS